MSRSRFPASLMRVMRAAVFAEQHKISTSQALEQIAAQREMSSVQHPSRRDFLRYGLGAASFALGISIIPNPVFASKSPRIAIVGAGLAGLTCADTLRKRGVKATVYEARSNRVGGRVLSSNAIAGRIVERGGEFIDSSHTTMLAYAKEFGLILEDRLSLKGHTYFYIGGQRYKEADLIDEFRKLIPRIQKDWDSLEEPTARHHTPAEKKLDLTDLATYLHRHAKDLPVLHAVLQVAYTIEYGLDLDQQSAINFLSMIDLEQKDKVALFGESDERYHIAAGNDRIAQGLVERLPEKVVHGVELQRLARQRSGKYELYFNGANKPELADAVVLAIPFSVLRHVELDRSLGLSDAKLRAIRELRYGTNAKTMFAFQGRPWSELHSGNGQVYADLPNLQNTWESGWGTDAPLAALTDYAGGARGLRLQTGAPNAPLDCTACHGAGDEFFHIKPGALNTQAQAILEDLDKVLPGTLSRASQQDGIFQIVRGHWVPQPTTRGSYTCNHPGYFTGLAGLEGQPAGLLKFAGEHTDSFYKAQGYMEGACRSGIAAANSLLTDIQHHRI